MIERIKYHWINDSKKTLKAEQEINIEGITFTYEQLVLMIDQFASVVAKSEPKLQSRFDDIKEIMENFIIDVASTNNLK
jgi:hypothetical protein